MNDGRAGAASLVARFAAWLERQQLRAECAFAVAPWRLPALLLALLAVFGAALAHGRAREAAAQDELEEAKASRQLSAWARALEQWTTTVVIGSHSGPRVPVTLRFGSRVFHGTTPCQVRVPREVPVTIEATWPDQGGAVGRLVKVFGVGDGAQVALAAPAPPSRPKQPRKERRPPVNGCLCDDTGCSLGTDF